MLPFDLPPPPPKVDPAPSQFLDYLEACPVELAQEGPDKKKKVDPYEHAFNRSITHFQKHLKKLSPKHKANVRKLHSKIDHWASQAKASGKRADKLSTYVGEVMQYADRHLDRIEKADPKLLQFRAEHRQFQALFLAGNSVIEAYLAWVRQDYKRKPKSRPRPRRRPS